MTKKTLGRKNRNGLNLDDLRSIVRDAEGMSPYTPVTAKTKMNGRMTEISIDEPNEPADSERDLWTDPRPATPGYRGSSLPPGSHPEQERPYFAPPND